jgi:predicted ribosomally synthesized peptide with SipW-like signal peptide
MKLNKKKVFVAALAICLVAILSMGTLAWFSATDDVDNDFFVATDADDTNPEFKVDLKETGLNGNPTDVGNQYYDVLPGETIAKDPTVTNTGDWDQWIRVTVTLDKANYWNAFGGSLKFTDLFKGNNITYGLTANVATDTTSTWLLVADEVTPVDDKAVWYLYLNGSLDAADGTTAAESQKVFDSVMIPENFTLDEMLTMGGTFSIDIAVDALQKDHTGANAVEAFANVGWADGTAFVDVD